MKHNENRVVILGAQILSAYDGVAAPAITATEQALAWLRQIAPYCPGDGEVPAPAPVAVSATTEPPKTTRDDDNPDLPVETEANAPAFVRQDWAPEEIEAAGESESVTAICEVPGNPEPADPWPQFAHLGVAMRDWAIRREMAKRNV